MRKILGVFATLLCANAFANITVPIPFQSITLGPNQILYAPYSFGLHTIIFCVANGLTNTSNIGAITWTYKGQIHSAFLPISLIYKNTFSGSLADSSGNLIITNNQSSNISVNCMFGF